MGGLDALSLQGNQSLEMEEQGSEARFHGWGPGLVLVASVVGGGDRNPRRQASREAQCWGLDLLV